jgi:hypothetical protein
MPNRTSSSAKVWGRRPYAGKSARELLNDVSRWISRTRPDDVDDPDDPALSDVIRHAGDALGSKGETPKSTTLSELMADGLDYQEAVVWYWFRYCHYDITEIHYAINGSSTGGDPAQRRNATRNILAVLQSAATKVDDADPDDVPDLIDDRKRHDRTEDL